MKIKKINNPMLIMFLLLFLLKSSLPIQLNTLINAQIVKANTVNEILPATITEVVDSLGNVNTNSWTKGTGGDWSCSPDCPDLEVEVGETITFTVTASDPNDLPLEYKFSAQPAGWSFNTLQDWSNVNTFSWTITDEYIGPWIVVHIAVRNNDGQEWQGEGNGDDYTYAIYTVTDPSKSPATITEVVDSLGNVNTNSWTKGTGGDWSCSPDCPDLEVEVGETITFTVTASDPNDLPLEYKFSAQPAGWSFNTLQDWSIVNTFSWTITDEYIGPWIVVSISVRNNDGQEWQGEGLGDDYTYAIYNVTDPSKVPATITQVEDSLGNVNTNSWTKETGGDWSCSPDCPDLEVRVGEDLTITATATDPLNLPIEYKFEFMRNGSMTTAQDWSSDNTLEWLVSLDDVGPWSGISVHVRNNDGQEWQGEGLGDDYNYLTYTIYNKYIDVISPESSPVGSKAIDLNIEGSNFESNSIVKFGDSNLSTTFINSTKLIAFIPEDLLKSSGEYEIKVSDPFSDGDESNSRIFKIDYELFLPIIHD